MSKIFPLITRHLCILCLLLSVSMTLSAQKTSYTITGTVYDDTGETLPGVTIYLKNKISVGTSTDTNGKFSIKSSHGDVIVFSFVGYQIVEYLVTEEKKDIEIRFSDQAQELEEVVVQALGTTQRRISSVAAVTSVDVKELQQPVASVANLLGGRVAGVMSLQTSGEPGKNISEFWVRGIGTFGANASALVLIDGLEGDINSLDAADIESFSVLKDASATAVYGVRGANGVVLITTKRGKTGKIYITGRMNHSLSQLKRMPEYLGSYDYAKLVNEAYVMRNEKPLYSDVELAVIQDGLDPDIYPDVNWQNEIMRKTSFRQSYYVSAQGGADIARYFLSLGGSKDDAAYKYDKGSPYSSNVGYSTYTYRANIDLELTPSTNLYFGTDGFLSITNYPGVASTGYIWDAQSRINPLSIPIRYSNGQYPAVGTEMFDISPKVMINQFGRRSDQEYRGKATIAINQDLGMLLEGLKIRAQGAYDLKSYFYEQRNINPALYQAVERDSRGDLVTILRHPESTASYGRSTNQFRKYHFETTLSYENIFGTDHRVKALVYYYLSDEKATVNSLSNLTAIPVRYQSVSGMVGYGFRDTYMIDLNFGYTGSENFQPGKQYGFFPSIALGWVPSSYDFVKENMSWVDLFKIRASYGAVGNDRITSRRFAYLTAVSTSYVNPWESRYTQGAGETTIGADNLQWEKSTKFDIGIEGKFLKNRLEFVVDFFNDQREGIFMERVQVPQYAGLLSMPYGNVGRMRSYGADGNISYMVEINRDMNFTLRGNFTYSKNNVQNWEEANPKYPYQEIAGYPHGTIRGYQSLGLFKDQHDINTSPTQSFGEVMPGDIKYRDVNGDGKIDDSDKVPLSYSTYPLLMYGFGGEFRYKQLTLGIMFKGTGKTDYYRGGMGYVPFYEGRYGNVLSLVNDPKNRWVTKEYAVAKGLDPSLAENPNALFPRLQYGYNSNNSQLSDFWKGDSRYLRLSEITLNYNLKNDFLRKIKVQSIDFQFVGSNLHVWDKVDIFDPEQAQYNGRVYPIPATYALQIYIHL